MLGPSWASPFRAARSRASLRLSVVFLTNSSTTKVGMPWSNIGAADGPKGEAQEVPSNGWLVYHLSPPD
ncbi:MAG: hypothetical protein ABI389_00825, partial [Rhodanobacter sp.]